MNRASSSLQTCVFRREKMEKFDNFISQFLIFEHTPFQIYVEKKFCQLYFTIIIPSIDIDPNIRQSSTVISSNLFHRKKMEKFNNCISQFLIFTNRISSSL